MSTVGNVSDMEPGIPALVYYIALHEHSCLGGVVCVLATLMLNGCGLVWLREIMPA